MDLLFFRNKHYIPVNLLRLKSKSVTSISSMVLERQKQKNKNQLKPSEPN